MKKPIARLLAAVAMTWLGSSAIAGEPCATCVSEQPAARGGWYVSAGVLYLKQTGSRDLAFGTNSYSEIDANGQTTLLASSISEFDHEYQWSGRIQAGVKDCSGFGLRASYFWINDSSRVTLLDNSGTQSNQDFPGVAFNEITGTKFVTANPLGVGFGTVGTESSPSIFAAERKLNLRAIDFDVTSDCHHGCLETTWFAGLRWMQIDQSYNAAEVILNTETFEFPNVLPIAQALTSNHSISAWGPTVGAEARYPVGCNFKAFGAGRFGLLYADGHQRVDVVKTGLNPDVFIPPIAPVSGAESHRCLVMPIGELELGGEYYRTIGCDGPEIFVRGSVLANAYWGAGTSARVNGANSPGNEDLIFFGFSLTAGVRY